MRAEPSEIAASRFERAAGSEIAASRSEKAAGSEIAAAPPGLAAASSGLAAAPSGLAAAPPGLAAAAPAIVATRTEAGDRLLDPEARLQHGRDVAWAALDRRDRTVAELARLLAQKRVEPAAIDTVVGELLEQGYLDDARYAQRFAEDRRRLAGWGAERIERRLRALGVGAAEIAAALGARDHGEELEAALAILRRRFPDPPATPRECERALGVLVRKGYELELAHDALRRHAGVRELD
jgi:regulatory protein